MLILFCIDGLTGFKEAIQAFIHLQVFNVVSFTKFVQVPNMYPISI